MHQTIRSSLRKLLDLLFPLGCLGCGAEGAWVCAPCERELPTILASHCPFCEAKNCFGNTCEACRARHFLDGAISCVPYAHPVVQSMIHAWKYNGAQALTPCLARFAVRSLRAARERARRAETPILETGLSKQMLQAIADVPALLKNQDVTLEPVPLHPKRERERGFNQALLLARALAAASAGWRLSQSAQRAKKTAAQAQLSGVDRRTNIADAFTLAGSEAVQGKHVVLVDDVITTGSTADALAQLLKQAGATSVWALTIAYGHPIKA